VGGKKEEKATRSDSSIAEGDLSGGKKGQMNSGEPKKKAAHVMTKQKTAKGEFQGENRRLGVDRTRRGNERGGNHRWTDSGNLWKASGDPCGKNKPVERRDLIHTRGQGGKPQAFGGQGADLGGTRG